MFKLEIPDFYPDAEGLRKRALAKTYKDFKSHEGATYKRVAVDEIPGLTERVEHFMGPVLMLGMGYRLNFNNELPNNSRHVDTGWGTHALVLYLSERKGPGVTTGTAFWDSVEDDANMVDICEEKLGKAVIYRSDQPHSRWPLEAYGTCPGDGRLIAVAFFTPLMEI